MHIYICLDCDPAYSQKARYTFEVLFDTLGFAYTFVDSNQPNKTAGGIFIRYGSSGDSKITETEKLTSILISQDWVEDIERIRVGFISTSRGRKLPVLGTDENVIPASIPDSGDDPVILKKDLIFSAFFLLSRWEETVCKVSDKHGRFPTAETMAHKHQFSQRAVVNEYLNFLYQIISQIAHTQRILLVRKCFWPEGQKLAVCLTHDVDIIEKWYLYSAVRCLELLKAGQLAALLGTFYNAFKGILSGKNPALALEKVTSVEDRFSFKSSFYFMTGKPNLKTLLSSDITYDLSKPKIRRQVEAILSEGFEVGLHASYRTSLDADLLLKEKEEVQCLIASPVQGLRQHFLRFRVPQSWIEQENCGFQYDTSLGFADQSGYRASFAFPFCVYDVQNDRRLDLMELPLIAMDRTYSKYLSFNPDQIKEDLIKMLEELEDFGGLVTILWHTHMVEELGFSGYPRLYEKILDFVHQKGYFVAPAKEIAEWWKKRKDLELTGRLIDDRKSYWEFVASASMDKLSLEMIDLVTEKVAVNGCDYEMVKEGQKAVVKLYGIKKGAKITIDIESLQR
jgi:hypothetical protein